MSTDPLAEALTDDERQGLDERIAAGLWGYYLHFDATGNPAVDRVLSAVGLAAKAFHHTEAWNDDLDWAYGPIPKGETCADFIQRTANDAAARIARVLDEAGLLAERTGRCCGCGDCEAPLHVHGCYADTGGCDDPTDHLLSAAPSECDDPLCGSDPHEHHGDVIKYLPKPAVTPSEDVEALASALREAGVERGYVGGDVFRQKVAERLLASDWLAAHDAQVRADERRRVLAEVEERRRTVCARAQL